MWLLSELSIFLLEHLFILRAGKKKGTRTPELCRFSVLTFGVSKSFPKSNRQFHVLMPSLVFHVKLEEMESKGKEKMNSVPWNCSFWMLLYFCSKAHWTWVGNIKTTYPASEICAVQQRQSWIISQTSRWNHKQSLRNTLHQNVPFGARLGKTNEHDRQRNAEKAASSHMLPIRGNDTHGKGGWGSKQSSSPARAQLQRCPASAPPNTPVPVWAKKTQDARNAALKSEQAEVRTGKHCSGPFYTSAAIQQTQDYRNKPAMHAGVPVHYTIMTFWTEINEAPAVLFCQLLKVNNFTSDKTETFFSSSCHRALIEPCSHVTSQRQDWSMTRKKAQGRDTHGIYGLPKFCSPPNFHTSSVFWQNHLLKENFSPFFLPPFTIFN